MVPDFYAKLWRRIGLCLYGAVAVAGLCAFGCQYLTRWESGITPRIDASGKQICGAKGGE